MLDNIGNDNYQFATGNDIDQFIDQMQTPKQNLDANEYEGLEELQEQETADTEPTEKVDTQMKSAAAKASGKLVTTVIDNTLPHALAFIAHDNADNYKADPESRQELEDAMTEYMRLKGGEIPPGMMVLLLILTIYGSKVPMAFQRRKLNEERERLNQWQKSLEEREQKLLKQSSATHEQTSKQPTE